ncbi:hypothetical protein [Saccharopolyspora hattusasensis]|uniref:hypothetical protein n=1 Tax=Saccharopolyspora hattusasensis TaxID=1128679 RepID=UPI003D9992D9
MERQLDLSDRETRLLNFLVTALAMRLKGVTDLNEVINEQYVREDEHAEDGYSQDVRITGRQLVWADDRPGPEMPYELRRHAVIADSLRRLNEINPVPDTRWRAELIGFTEAEKVRGFFERIDLWRVSTELAAELDAG